MIELKGIFAPITTPFDPVTGDLDPLAMARNAEHLAATGLDGLVLFGTTGEGLLVAEDERTIGLEAVRAVVADGLVLAAAGAESTRAAIRLARLAAAAGADAALVAPPAYYRPQMTAAALQDHFAAVADACPIPVILYQVPPAYSGIELSADVVGALARHPNIVGIKDSRGDLKMLGHLLEISPSDFAVLVGSGGVLHGALRAGAAGGILAVADLAPEWCREVASHVAADDEDAAAAVQQRLAIVHSRIVGAHGVPGVKAALDLLGHVGGQPRSPLRELGEAERAMVRETLEGVGLLQTARAA